MIHSAWVYSAQWVSEFHCKGRGRGVEPGQPYLGMWSRKCLSVARRSERARGAEDGPSRLISPAWKSLPLELMTGRHGQDGYVSFTSHPASLTHSLPKVASDAE